MGLDKAGTVKPLGTVEVFFPGAGHAPDNLMVWIPSAHVLFGGCAVRTQAQSTLGNVAHAELTEWRAAMGRAAARYTAATLVVPGHGAPGDLGLLRHTLELLGR
jgi:glyoxylase-like metal-dependent hydrolase (beta-lactamase superfamily II)